MKNDRIQEEWLRIIMYEYKRNCDGIHLLANAMIRDFQIFIAFLAALFALSFKSDSKDHVINYTIFNIIIVLMPFFIFIFALFLLMKLSQMVIAAASIQYIENKVNNFFESTLLTWESLVNPNLINAPSSSYLWISIVFGIVLLFGYFLPIGYINHYNLFSSNIIYKDYATWLNYSYIIMPIIILILLILIFYERKASLSKITKIVNENNRILKKN